MRIQHNIAALNSYRQLNTNNSAISKNLEKLSSGYKINRAGDDAAGLAISEKMRAQITGLETAQKNANDGISLVQTAEGALTEVHSMLNRMVELATQSSNGTYSDDVDRENLQAEVDSLKEEIDRISEGTNFNGINLLDGSLGSTSGTSTGVKVDFAGLDANADFLKLNSATAQKVTIDLTGVSGVDTDKETTLEFTFADADGNLQTKTVSFTAADAALNDGGNDDAITEALQDAFGDEYTVAGSSGSFTITAKNAGASDFEVFKVGVKKADGSAPTGTASPSITQEGADAFYSIDISKLERFDGTNADNAIFEINGQKFAFTDATKAGELDPDVHYVSIDTANPDTNDRQGMIDLINAKTGLAAGLGTGTVINLKESEATGTTGKGLVLQVGDTADDFNKITVEIGAMDTASLGIAGIDIGTAAGADAAIDKIKAAINTVSSTRGDLGAIQNRLEHTINNLGVTTENITSAESRIRDTDMADEMMAYTKNNILVQASQAMLAQANTLPQGVLQLLQ